MKPDFLSYINKTAIALLTLSLMLTACSGENAESDWLSGRWHPVHNPMGDADDTLNFHGDGTLTVETVDDRKIEGTYRIKDRFVIVNLDVPKRPTEVRFMIGKDKRRLMFSNGAYFEKR